jgi:hypothetical protein
MPDRPVRVTVSQVRQRIFEVSGRPAEGAGSLAGQLFHDAARCALTDSHPSCWKSALTATLDEEAWLASLYDTVLGPALTRMQPALGDSGEVVLALWDATRHFAQWFCGLLRETMDRGALRYDGRREQWVEESIQDRGGAGSLFEAERDAERLFRDPAWSRPVLVSGRIDQLVRVAPGRWCAVELKLGGGHPEADAAQLCLYHELLGGDGSAALLRFGAAGVEELLLQKPSIEQARPKLLALIGALAGVTVAPPTAPPVGSANDGNGWPRKPGDAETVMGQKLERTLREYGAEAQLAGEPQVGPAFVRFLLEPQRGITVARIENRGAELQMRLGLDQEPIIHRLQGRIAVDVQRRDREDVRFSDLRPSLGPPQSASSRVLAGMDLRGKLHFIDLARESAHILVGGSTGGGKTEWLRAAVASLIVANTPQTLRLAVVDPKQLSFRELSGSPFLWREDALVDSPDIPILPLLENLIAEMTLRNALLKQAAADDLAEYRRKTGQAMPRAVLLVDEFAELLSGSRKQRDEFEQAFIRIAAVGRAAGIHLILATQRPSRQVVSGNLKANLPTKIAMRVATGVDSRVLIDQPGAERLLGRGDLLVAGLSIDPIRLQSAWLNEAERRLIFGSTPIAPS